MCVSEKLNFKISPGPPYTILTPPALDPRLACQLWTASTDHVVMPKDNSQFDFSKNVNLLTLYVILLWGHKQKQTFYYLSTLTEVSENVFLLF